MTQRLGKLALLLGIVLVFWFLAFGALLPEAEALATRTDAVVVLTGGPGRLERGIDVIRAKSARRMLVSGVDPSVRAAELAALTRTNEALFDCCIDLGKEAADTRGNAEETAAWVAERGYTSVRLVTSDYHLARAQMELEARLGPGVAVVGDPVPNDLRAGGMAREFSKYALRLVALTAGAS